MQFAGRMCMRSALGEQNKNINDGFCKTNPIRRGHARVSSFRKRRRRPVKASARGSSPIAPMRSSCCGTIRHPRRRMLELIATAPSARSGHRRRCYRLLRQDRVRQLVPAPRTAQRILRVVELLGRIFRQPQKIDASRDDPSLRHRQRRGSWLFGDAAKLHR
jgi:hypothetical protein